ncbi:MFS transporter superfamily [Sesbania bispinosa]|nr:MFS transporter superfamily [Sesbania bispinosa]
MPVNNSSLSEKLVGECNVKGISNFSTNRRARKLAIDSYHNMLQAIWFSDHVLHIKLKDIFSAIGWIPPAKEMNAIHKVYKISKAQTLIALLSIVPGYRFTVAFIDYTGRFAIQFIGFFFMTVFMYALAIPYDYWTKKENRIGFVVMYSLTFFFANFGPNATTFVVPAEILPARLRFTCHGISAAAGKAGAIVGALGFLHAAQSKDPTKTDKGYPTGIGIKNSLIMLVVINFAGMLFTLLVPKYGHLPSNKLLQEEEKKFTEWREKCAIAKASISRMDTTTTKENNKVLTETLERWRCGGGRCQSRKLSPPSNEIGKSSEMEVEVGVGRSWGLIAWEMVVGFSKEMSKTREKGGRLDGVGDGSRVFLHCVCRE